MSDSNRVQLAFVRETELGTTPVTPRMRKARFTGESLNFKPLTEDSEELRDDRMNADPMKVGEQNDGSVNFELTYPVPGTFHAEMLASSFMSDWMDTPSRDNDGTADSVITDIGTTADTLSCTTGAPFVIGHLVKTTGFATPANNALVKVTTGGATSFVATGSGYAAEVAPPATARAKVVGFEGGAADITATANGLASTTLDFTTLGLQVGTWVKIGGTAVANKFAAAALNDWARVVAISAHALTLDNLPSGWAIDAGTGKSIRVFFGDFIKNGTSKIGSTLERGYLGQVAPTYIAQRGMAVDEYNLQIDAKKKITGSYAFMGLGGGAGTVPLDASPDAAPAVAAYPVFAAGANVGRIAENGVGLSSPNFVKSFGLKIKNNLRMIDAADNVSSVDLGVGSCDVTVTANTYFGSDTLYAKMMAGTATNMSTRATKNNQALIFAFPRLTPVDGSPNAQGKNQDVMLPLTLKASLDALTNAHVILNRLEYYE